MQLERFEESLFPFDELILLSQSLLCLRIIKWEVFNAGRDGEHTSSGSISQKDPEI